MANDFLDHVRAPTAAFFLGEHSVLTDTEYVAESNRFREIVEITPTPAGAATLGATTTIYINRHWDVIGQIWLRMQFGALKAAPGAGAYSDGVAYAVIDRLEVFHGSNELATYSGDYFQSRHELYTPWNKREDASTAQLVSLADRRTAAEAVQDLFLRLPLFWTENESQHLPLFHLNNDIRIVIRWRTAAEITAEAGTAAATMTPTLMCEMFHIDEPESAKQGELMHAKNARWGDTIGWVRPVDRPILFENQPIAAAATTTTFTLTGMIYPVRDFWFTYRTGANWNTARTWYLFSDITSWRATAAQRTLIDTRTFAFQLFQYNRTHTAASSKEEIAPIYYHSFSDRSMNSRDDYGFFHFETINNTQIIVTGHPAGAANDRVDFYFHTRSLLLISPVGGMSMVMK